METQYAKNECIKKNLYNGFDCRCVSFCSLLQILVYISSLENDSTI